MALVNIYITRAEGEDPRRVVVDDFIGPKGEEVKGGASLIESLKRQVKREQLFAVKVEPIAEQPVARPRKATKAAPESE